MLIILLSTGRLHENGRSVRNSGREVKFLGRGSGGPALRLISSRCGEGSGASYVRTTVLSTALARACLCALEESLRIFPGSLALRIFSYPLSKR